MDGRVGGLNLTGREMRTWPASGITLPENGMETLMTKVTESFCVYAVPVCICMYDQFSVEMQLSLMCYNRYPDQ